MDLFGLFQVTPLSALHLEKETLQQQVLPVFIMDVIFQHLKVQVLLLLVTELLLFVIFLVLVDILLLYLFQILKSLTVMLTLILLYLLEIMLNKVKLLDMLDPKMFMEFLVITIKIQMAILQMVPQLVHIFI